MRALCMAVVGIASCGPGHPGTGQPRPPAADRDLTPESLGLPATPDGDPPAPARVPVPVPIPGPVPAAAGSPSGYYHHEECPPGRYGCVVSRTVTDERVTTTLSCPAGHGSFTGGKALRRLTATRFRTLTPDDAAAALVAPNLRSGDALPPVHIRSRVIAHLDQFESCFADVTAPLTMIDVEMTLGLDGAVLADRQAAPDDRCVTAVLRAIRFPPSRTGTIARWRFEYTATDPSTVTPLDCSGAGP